MQRMEGPSLEITREVLDLEGLGAQVTEYVDGIVHQVVSLSPFVRRGRTFAPSTGIYTARLANVHTDADTLDTSIDPYNPGQNAENFNGFPGVVPAAFDVWLCGARIVASGGTGTLGDAACGVAVGAQWMGIADNASTGVAALTLITLAVNGETAFLGSRFGTVLNTVPTYPMPMRIRRGDSYLRLSSTNAGAGATTLTVVADLLLGLFPAALGQDAV